MSAVKQFGAHASRGYQPKEGDPDAPPPVEVPICDEQITFLFPGTGQLSFFGALRDLDDPLQQGADFMRFFSSMIDGESGQRYITKMLLQRRFDLDDAMEVLEYLMEEWGHRPTQAASGSSPSQRNTGKPSTASSRRAASKRSTSRSTGSSTSSTPG